MVELPWTSFKAFVDARALSIQWVEADSTYFMFAFDGPMALRCAVYKDSGADQTAFEATYQALGNKPIPSTISAFTAKTFGTKKLFARNTGKQFAVAAGSNDLTYTATFAWVKFIGLELVGSEALDTGELRVYDDAAGTYSGVPNALLNQFGYTMNFPKDFYSRSSPFDADLYVGMVMKITYVSASAKTIGINYIMNEVKT